MNFNKDFLFCLVIIAGFSCDTSGDLLFQFVNTNTLIHVCQFYNPQTEFNFPCNSFLRVRVVEFRKIFGVINERYCLEWLVA